MSDSTTQHLSMSVEPGGTGGISVQPQTKPLRIMIVDDNVDSADLLGMFFCSEGHKTQVEYGAASALAKISRYAPHIVIIDIGMPHVDGCDLVRQARQMPELRFTHFVAFSGYTDLNIRLFAIDSGFHRYLTKPNCISVFLDVIAEYQLNYS